MLDDPDNGDASLYYQSPPFNSYSQWVHAVCPGIYAFPYDDYCKSNQSGFHEDCTIGIARRLVRELDPVWLRIGGYWYPRGGIPIDVFYQTGAPPEGLWLPYQGVPPYRGRG